MQLILKQAHSYVRPCTKVLKDLSNTGETIDDSLSSYFVEVSQRLFKRPDMMLSLYDIPVIYEPSAYFVRDFNYTAFLHMNKSSSKISWKALELSNDIKDGTDLKNCMYIPTKLEAKSVTLAFNEEDSKLGKEFVLCI